MLKVSNQHPTQFEEAAQKSVEAIFKNKPPVLSGIEAELKKYTQTPDDLKKFKSQHKFFFVVGIGGSSLGSQVLAEAFQIKNIKFIDNVDATHFEMVLSQIENLSETGWLFISKSGNTIETLAGLDFISQHLASKNLELKKHCIVITEKKESDLYNWSKQNETLFFEVPLTVGGRFSVLTSVGLVPAILMNLNIEKIQTGALKAYQDQEILKILTQEALQSFKRNEWVSVLWSYSSRLKSFGFWWQQLWAESLAKKTDNNGHAAPRVSTPLPFVGATDQHSTLQQIMEGARDKMVFFLRANDAENSSVILNKSNFSETKLLQGKNFGALLKAEAEAIQQALTEVGVSNTTLQVNKIDEEGLGHLIMFFQLWVISLGQAMNINTFNQPGVELGKVMTKKNLTKN